MNDEPEKFVYLCAWCKKEMRPSAVMGTHGICISCFRKHFPEQLEYLKTYMPAEYAKLMEEEAAEDNFRKNPEYRSRALNRVAQIATVFEYYYKALEPAKRPELLKKARKRARKALKIVSHAIKTARANESEAKKILAEAEDEIRQAIYVLHGE